MTASAATRHRQTGFTLVELLITVVIALIIAGIAYPTLQQAVQKSRRADGMGALASLMQAQERWRSSNPAYQSKLDELPGAPTVSNDQHYQISIVEDSVTATAYTARATARSGSPQSSDTRCRTLQVAINGGAITYSSESSSGANAAPDPCWVR